MGRFYTLCGDRVVEEADFRLWAAWHAQSYEKVRCIESTSLMFGRVVTVFLGVNMAVTDAESPLLFETRVHGGWLAEQWERYSSIDEARAGHHAWVTRVRALEQEKDVPPPDCRAW